MNLSEITQNVLRMVETRSGIPVRVEPDPNLPVTTPAKVVMARGNLSLHRVFYRPESSSPPDYLICSPARRRLTRANSCKPAWMRCAGESARRNPYGPARA